MYVTVVAVARALIKLYGSIKSREFLDLHNGYQILCNGTALQLTILHPVHNLRRDE